MLLGVDVGGTFTDAVVFDGQALHTAKAPTTPDDQARGVIAAIEAVLERAGADEADVDSFAHGMTVGTNALLTEGGADTALVATDGFTDLLEIGRQARPELYRPCAAKPVALVAERLGVAERIGPDGVIESLGEGEPERLAAAVRAAGVKSVAICLLFSYLDEAHERAVAAHLRKALPSVHVSVSSEVLPQFREFERCSTTVVDAYLAPLLASYLESLGTAAAERGLPEPSVMRSSGGLAPASEARRSGAWSVLSGPAGGAVGASLLASLSGDGNAIGLDMGGTSCDVCVVESGQVRRTDGRTIGGRPIQLPMVDVHTVGAGGGSIGWIDHGGALRVGPRSAGAEPGPACYGRGGADATVTDANLALGHLSGDGGLAGGVELDAEAAELGARRARRTAWFGRGRDRRGHRSRHEPGDASRAARCDGRAWRGPTRLRPASLRRRRPASCRGACRRARNEPNPAARGPSGVLCALGLVASEHRRDTARTVMLSGEDLSSARVAEEVAALRKPLAEGFQEARAEAAYDLRYRGQAFELTIGAPAEPELADLVEAFEAEHERRYGYRDEAGAVELVNVRLALVADGPTVEPRAASGRADRAERTVRSGGDWTRAEVIRGEPEARLEATGPVRLRAAGSDARPARGLDGAGRCPRDDRCGARRVSLDPVTLQVLVGGFRAACEEMGAVLIRASHSANIKERHDCSTALFAASGELVMQAEHIPVHLGSMPDAVAAVLGDEQQEGGLWILNDPFAGGTHLPDITLIAPLFSQGALLAFTASRAHHADVGGPTPGGMPADSRRLEEEGVIIEPTRVVEGTLEELAAQMRNPAERLADLRAQRAALAVGAERAWRARRSPRPGDDPHLDGGDPRLHGASHPRPPRRAEGWRAGRPRTSWRGRENVVLRVTATPERRFASPRLLSQRRPGRRQPQLPARGYEVGRLLRGPRPDRPRRASVRGLPPPDRDRRALGLRAERQIARRRRGGQRGDLQPRGRPGDRRAGRRA